MNREADAREARDASVTDLVSGIVSDTGDLLGAHVDAVRNEMSQGLDDLRDRLRATIFAAAAMITTAIALMFAIAATLIELGLMPFVAYWIVAAMAAAGLVLLLKRAGSKKAGPAGGDPAEALARAGRDAAWLADRASDAVT